MSVLNSTTPNTHFLFATFGHNYCIIRIIANFVSKFPNFRYHGNKGRFFNSNEAVGNFFKGHVGTFPRSMRAKFKVYILSHLRAVGIQRPKNLGSRYPDPIPYSRFFSGVMLGLCLGARVPNLKLVSLAILELLAFNAQKIGSHVTLATPLLLPFDLQGLTAPRDVV